MWRSRSFWWLFGSFGLLVLAAIGMLGSVVIQRVEQQFLRQIEQDLHAKAVLVREAMRGHKNDPPEQLQERLMASRATQAIFPGEGRDRTRRLAGAQV